MRTPAERTEKVVRENGLSESGESVFERDTAIGKRSDDPPKGSTTEFATASKWRRGFEFQR